MSRQTSRRMSPLFLARLAGPGRSRGVLMRPDDRTVDEPHFPVHGALRLGGSLELLQELLPEALPLPAAQPVMTGLPGAVALGQIPPGSAGAQDPQDPVDDPPVVFIGMPALARPLRRQQRLQAVPLGIRQVSACHSGSFLPT